MLSTYFLSAILGIYSRKQSSCYYGAYITIGAAGSYEINKQIYSTVENKKARGRGGPLDDGNEKSV
jgi:hypothetical protein